MFFTYKSWIIIYEEKDPNNQSARVMNPSILFSIYGLSFVSLTLLNVFIRYKPVIQITLETIAVNVPLIKIYCNNLDVSHEFKIYVFIIAKRLNASIEVIKQLKVILYKLNILCFINMDEKTSKPIPSNNKAVGPHKKNVDEQLLNPIVFALKMTAIIIMSKEVPGFGK